MSARTWNVLHPSGEITARLVSELGVSPTVATVLANRGLADPAAARDFLAPDLARLHSPLLMRDMDEAVLQVVQTIRSGGRILVWGDYDVDGVSSTALLVEFLRRHTPAVSWRIPHRIDEGYGLDEPAVRRAAADQVALVITVDCGISDARAVAAGRELGLAFVITDHHEPPDELPPAEAILNPRRPGCRYPFKHLAGVGIAFKLAQAVALLIGPGTRPGDAGDAGLTSLLDLVALGTVADVAPLVGENRILVRHGLAALGATRRPGLRALMKVAGIDTRPLRTSQIGFGLGPRINAAGRLGHAGRAVELLLEEDPARSEEIAVHLDGKNRRRQEIEQAILVEAEAMIAADPSLRDDPVLVLAAEGWHPGVIGIVAAKLADRRLKPALLISTGREPGRGSARSVPSLDLFVHLRSCERHLAAYGGHAHAAGVSVRAADIPALRRDLNLAVAEHQGAGAPLPPLDIDATLDFGRIRPALADELRRLAPFGHRNPEPVFLAAGARLAQPPRIVGNNHLRLALLQKPHLRQFIGFSLGRLAGSLAPGMSVDVAYDLDLEGAGTWDRCRIRDLRPAGGGDAW